MLRAPRHGTAAFPPHALGAPSKLCRSAGVVSSWMLTRTYRSPNLGPKMSCTRGHHRGSMGGCDAARRREEQQRAGSVPCPCCRRLPPAPWYQTLHRPATGVGWVALWERPGKARSAGRRDPPCGRWLFGTARGGSHPGPVSVAHWRYRDTNITLGACWKRGGVGQQKAQGGAAAARRVCFSLRCAWSVCCSTES